MPVGTAGAFRLNGNAFGVDFDPYYVGPLRVVSDLDQNLLVNPNDGTLFATETPLAYASGDPNFGVNPNIVGTAYRYNYGGGLGSRPLGIDSGRDVLVLQGTGTLGLPDNGQLTTIGALGVDTIDEVGFDISGITGVAYASLTSRIGPLDTSSDLYTINLTTGAATLIGSIGQVGGPGAFETRDIAAPVGTPAPEPGTLGLIAGGLVPLVGRRRIRHPRLAISRLFP
jgi:hypothetical protein